MEQQQQQTEAPNQDEKLICVDGVNLDQESLSRSLRLVFLDRNCTLEERLALVEIDYKNGWGIPIEDIHLEYMGKNAEAEFKAAKQWLKGYIANRKN
jgi:hypothetical protein